MNEQFLTVREAAYEYKVSTWTVRHWLRNRKHGLQAVRAGRKLLISRRAMDAFVRASTKAGAQRKPAAEVA